MLDGSHILSLRRTIADQETLSMPARMQFRRLLGISLCVCDNTCPAFYLHGRLTKSSRRHVVCLCWRAARRRKTRRTVLTKLPMSNTAKTNPKWRGAHVRKQAQRMERWHLCLRGRDFHVLSNVHLHAHMYGLYPFVYFCV